MTCDKPVDIAFVIDTSSSVWIEDYNNHLIPFVHDVISKLDVGERVDQSRVAAITFSNKVEVQFYFDQFTNKEDVLNAIKEIPHDKGDATRTYLGLKETRLKLFDSTRGERKGVKNIVVVLTDGGTNAGGYDYFPDGDKNETKKEAKLLREELDAAVFAIGIGDDKDVNELKDIASDPDETYVITENGYKELNTERVKDELVDRTCEGKKVTLTHHVINKINRFARGSHREPCPTSSLHSHN